MVSNSAGKKQTAMAHLSIYTKLQALKRDKRVSLRPTKKDSRYLPSDYTKIPCFESGREGQSMPIRKKIAITYLSIYTEFHVCRRGMIIPATTRWWGV